MTPDQADTAERERRRNEVLAACLEDPVLAAEVVAFFADHDRLARLARPLHRPAPPPFAPHAGAKGEESAPLSPRGGRRVGEEGAEVPAAPSPAEAPTLSPGDGTAPGPAPVPIRSFGDYELLKEVARGVWA